LIGATNHEPGGISSRNGGLSLRDFDDSFSKRLRRFLRQIVSDTALDSPVLVSTAEFS
jgi:hypothetical protein